jgi:ophiobolin F synthase
MDTNHPSDDATSVEVNITNYDTHGLGRKFTLRRHKYENEANAGCYEARSDWIKYVGPADRFGGCNPVNGNLSSVLLPLCKPERLRLVSYVLECKLSRVVLSCIFGWLKTSQTLSY